MYSRVITANDIVLLQDYAARSRRKNSAVMSLLTAGCICAAVVLILFCFFHRRLCSHNRMSPSDDTSSLPDVDNTPTDHISGTATAGNGQYQTNDVFMS
jgi:hypothetical protein